MNKKRTLTLLVVLILVGAAAVGGWVIGSRIESPAEAAARTAPPKPSPILVPVEQRVLSSEIVTRGTARFGLPQPISIAPSSLKTSAGLITTLPTRNRQFKEGDVLLTASGRPVFVLTGDVPAYRDLVPGISGNDVLQLEQALVRLGIEPGQVDGSYDQTTSAAVAQWYSSAGWEPFGPTAAQLAHVRSLEQQLGDARKVELTANGTAAAAGLAVAAARATAEQGDKAAAADVEAKLAALAKLKAELSTAAAAVDAAEAAAEHANRIAAAELSARIADQQRLIPDDGGVSLAVESAQAQADRANKAARAEISARIHDRALIVVDPRQTRSARAAADAQLELARASAFDTQLQGELAVATAKREADSAVERHELAQAAVKAAELEGKRAVQAAIDAQQLVERDVKNGELQVELAKATARATELEGKKIVQAALDAQQIAEFDARLAARRAAQLAADLKTARGKLGVQVPVDELVFLPSLPARVHEVSVVVGDAASGPVMAVTDNQLAIDSALPLDAAPLVAAGMPVAIDEQALGVKAKGVIQHVAEAPGTRGVDAYHFYFEIRVTETPTPLEGFSLRLNIPIESTTGSVTAVPVSALSLAADGTSRVQVDANGKLEYVVVEPGLTADGFVEVTPVQGTLSPGDLVVVGYEAYEEESLPFVPAG